MSFSPSRASVIWIAILACAFGFLVWTNMGRLQRVEYISGLAGWAEQAVEMNAKSLTGYAQGQRSLIVPERNEDSFHWIAQTQQMFAQREWRVRQVSYDNAPYGREVASTSPYRWWLGLVAWADHALSGRPIGISVERAALYADPVLHGVLLVTATVFVAWQFGALAAGLVALGLVALFPFAAGFLPGVPNHQGLANLCALWSLLLVFAGLESSQAKSGGEGEGTRRTKLWFALAGVMGGLGMWVAVSALVPILGGVFLGALVFTSLRFRRMVWSQDSNVVELPWRIWAISGGATVLIAYLAEYFPAHLGTWRLDLVHPVYGLSWIGAGEILAQMESMKRERGSRWNIRVIGGFCWAVAALVTLPVAMKLTESRAFLTIDLSALRLSNQAEGAVALNFPAWIAREGMTTRAWATVLPLTLLIPALWMLFRKNTGQRLRRTLCVALGPVLVALGFAYWRLNWWSLFDGSMLMLLAVLAAADWGGTLRTRILIWTGVIGMLALSGIRQVVPRQDANGLVMLTRYEAQELVERDLAHWLAKRAGEKAPVVYAPPLETGTLCYYGSLRGVGTFSPDNRAGFGATLMIAGMQTLGEVQALLEGRGVRYIVVPSWDPFFDEFGPLYLAKNYANRTSHLINELRSGSPPFWLKPVAYQMPVIPGFEGQSVLVFEVVEEQSPAIALSRLAEYWIEMGDLKKAAIMETVLRRFPGEIGALAARAQVQNATGETANAAQTLDLIEARLTSGADRTGFT